MNIEPGPAESWTGVQGSSEGSPAPQYPHDCAQCFFMKREMRWQWCSAAQRWQPWYSSTQAGADSVVAKLGRLFRSSSSICIIVGRPQADVRPRVADAVRVNLPHMRGLHSSHEALSSVSPNKSQLFQHVTNTRTRTPHASRAHVCVVHHPTDPEQDTHVRRTRRPGAQQAAELLCRSDHERQTISSV